MEHCDRFLALISQALDEPLSLEDQQALDGHLAQCPQCRELKQQLEEIQDELGAWQEQEVPDGFAQGVMDRIRALERPSSNLVPFWKRPQVRALGSLAACVLICVGVMRAGLGRPDNMVAPAGLDVASSTITADSESAVTSPALGESRDESGSDSDSMYCAVTSGAPIPQPAALQDAAAVQGRFASSEPAEASDHITSESVLPSDSGMLFSSTPQAYSAKAAGPEASPELNGEALLQSVRDVLGAEPGTVLVTTNLPDGWEEAGTWYSTQEGYAVLVLEDSPSDELYQALVQDALLCLEVGDGVFTVLLWPE